MITDSTIYHEPKGNRLFASRAATKGLFAPSGQIAGIPAIDPSRIVSVARGDEPADLLLTNARLIDVLSSDIRSAEIAIAGPFVAGIGKGYRGREVVDVQGRYVCPGFIDAHVHLDSALVRPREFARAVVPRGVTTVVTNPHEIANVLGIEGIRFMLRDAELAPLHAFFSVPSCVPATRLATSGAELKPSDLKRLFSEPWVIGLGEVMDFLGAVSGDLRVLKEIHASQGRPIDGHCPGLSGKALNAYAAAGITSDHESTSVKEAKEKLRLGLKIFIREGSVARNLKALLPLITPNNERWLCFCTDDRQPPDLLEEGSMDHLVRVAIAQGVHPITAIRIATLNPAEHFRLYDRGIIVPGRRADLVIFDNLDAPQPDLVYHGGTLVARGGTMVTHGREDARPGPDPDVRNTVHVDWARVDLRIPARGNRARVIGVVPGQLLTECLFMESRIVDGWAVADPAQDLLKIAVIERHHASGRVGLGFVKGMGLTRGAIASTIAHDHHNLIVIGADDESMATAARAVARAGGGQAVAGGERILSLLPLPIAGLMSDEPVEQVRDRMTALIACARALGSTLHDPFMVMSFLGLEVIPALKLTDLGLVDVNARHVVPLFPRD
jgi:adenine deaminase